MIYIRAETTPVSSNCTFYIGYGWTWAALTV